MTLRCETSDRPYMDDFPRIIERLGLPSRPDQKTTFGFSTISGLPDQENRRIRQAWLMGIGTPVTINDYGLIPTKKHPTLRTLELTFEGLDISILTQTARQVVADKIKLTKCFSLKPRIKGRLKIGFVNQGIVKIGILVERYEQGEYVEEGDLTALFNNPAHKFASKETFSYLTSFLQRMPLNGEVYNRRQINGLPIDIYRDKVGGGRQKNTGKKGYRKGLDRARFNHLNDKKYIERLEKRREAKRKAKRGN